MGVVYRAHDTNLERDVALKLIAPALAGDPDFRARFETEARAAAAVDHPNVLPVFEAGEDGGELYLAMRLVEGTDLKAVLAGGRRLAPERAAAIVAQIAAALDAAHMRNLIHRDVKPANALIATEGSVEHVYLTDFGLTQTIGDSGHLTSPGQIVGTANYISPEQVEGRPIDGRVDVYALACVTFECLTGTAPFARDTVPATLAAHVQDAIPAATRRAATLPREVDDVLAGGLAKSPQHRFASCGAFAQALGTALGTGTGEIPHDPAVAAHARPPQPASVGPAVPARSAPTAVLERSAPARRHRGGGGQIAAALFALLVAGTLAAAAIFLLPRALDGGESKAGQTSGLRLLSGAAAVNGELSALISDLTRDPTDAGLRADQEGRLPALRARVGHLLVATRRSAEPEIQPQLTSALAGQRRLLGQYEQVLSAAPAYAQPLIDAMIATLHRVDRNLHRLAVDA